MYSETITLKENSQIKFEWEAGFHSFTVSQNGRILDEIPLDQLKNGKNVRLEDGTSIMPHVSNGKLAVWKDGVNILTGKASGSSDHFGSACTTLYILAALQLVGGVIIGLISGEQEIMIATIIAAVAISGLLAGLGYWAKSQGTQTPFWIGIGFCVLNIVLTLSQGSAGGIVVSCVAIYYLYKGTQSEPLWKPKAKNIDTLDGDML